jgi:tetratricopeptide (TPR) repeat protein
MTRIRVCLVGPSLLALLWLGVPAPSLAAPPQVTPQDQLIDRGNAAFRQGRIAEALQLYQQARAHGESPELLFNLAQCHRKLGQTKEAVRLFRAYLAQYPTAPNRAVVERLLGRLGASPEDDALDPQVRTPPVLPAAPAVEPGAAAPVSATAREATGTDARPGRPWYRRWYVWAGIGAVVVAGAVVGGVVGSRGGSGPPSSSFGNHNFFSLRVGGP